MIPLGRCCFLGDPISKECHITLTKETGSLGFLGVWAKLIFAVELSITNTDPEKNRSMSHEEGLYKKERKKKLDYC